MKKEILLTTIILSSFLSSCDSFSSDVPTFTGYVAQDVQIIENSHIKLSRKFNQNSSLEEMSEENNIDNNQITDKLHVNKNDAVFVTLQFINDERDTFVDLVLNDSLTGNDLVFDSNSKKNRVHSVENYKKDGKWYTDITVVLKASTDYIQRTIEVKEVNFLRQVINKSIQADLNHSYSKTIEVEVSQSFVPNSIYFYEYKEVQIEEKTGIEITKLIGDYGYPKTVYFPEYIDGLPVISIGINIVPIDDNLHFSNCVVPESVSYFHGRLLNENVGWIDEKVIILSKELKSLSYAEWNICGGDPDFYIFQELQIFDENSERLIMSFNKPIREVFGTELYFISSIEPFAYKHCDEVCENKSSSYVNDFDGHWKTCSCGYGHDFGYHEDENGDGKCDVCYFRFY